MREKDGAATPPVGTRVSCFERSLLEPNSAQLSPRPKSNIITQLIPVQRSPRVFSRAGIPCVCTPLSTSLVDLGLVAAPAHLCPLRWIMG